MATIGVDCELIIDGTGYFVKPGSYQMIQPRVRKTTVRADNNEAYVDLGPGKREWKMVILCLNDMKKYDGTLTGLTGQQYRDALRTSYTGSVGTTINYTDPIINGPIAVHFDHYAEIAWDLHSQAVQLATGGNAALSYEVVVELIEA
jgi:hypothetical protein